MKQYTMDKRLALLDEWRLSGKSVNQFCRENKIKVPTFHGWNKRYNNQSQPLVEIPIKQNPLTNLPSTIQIRRGYYQIEIKDDFDPISLKKVLSVLERLHD